MSRQLKHLAMQVIVITGATSRIGLATARMAAGQGASLVLAASNAATLDRLATEIRQAGGVVLAVTVDVGVQDQVAALGKAAMLRFGRVDTWVNAGMALGELDEINPSSVAARLFKSHYYGALHGASVARDLMRQEGGAIINLDSTASERHGVKGYTDTLRASLDIEGAPLSVTLVHAVAARTDIDSDQAPRRVAEAILHAAQHPQRDVLAGAPAPVAAPSAGLAPRLLHKLMGLIASHQPQKASYS